MDEATIARVIERTRQGGAEILALKQTSSAYDSPAAAIATIVEAIIRNRKSIEPPVRNGTEGPPAVDISPLYRDFGYFTYDPGFVSTASCRSSITFIDGEQGVLLYRGYPIEQLAEKSPFIEVAYLLLYGDLPNEEQLNAFTQVIVRHTMINESLKSFY